MALSIHLREILRHPVFKPRAVLVLIVLTTQIVISGVVLAPQPRWLMGAEILAMNLAFLGLNLRYRVQARFTPGAALTIAIRVIYLWAAFSLVIGVGGGFYVLGAILLVTLARSISSCWALLTALDTETATA